MSEIRSFVQEVKDQPILPLERIYEDYYHWCEKSGSEPVSRTKFNKEVHNFGHFEVLSYQRRRQKCLIPFI